MYYDYHESMNNEKHTLIYFTHKSCFLAILSLFQEVEVKSTSCC